MKKLVFTALAVVAFSGAAMAGTHEVKSEKKLIGDSCDRVCHLAYDLAIKEGANHSTADAYADIAYANCIKTEKSIAEAPAPGN
jgi:hypothetical protein